jgi:tyrosyl-tRNA synthetase
MGGSDQWGNITTGTELIRRKTGGEAYALTIPLVTKSDGGKFGKTEQGNVWLDSRYTSPYRFYQFWLNVSDDDAAKYIKIFTMLTKQEVDALILEHNQAPHLRVLQKKLAELITTMVHSEADYQMAVEASGILFGNATADTLKKLDEETFLSVFEGVSTFDVSLDSFEKGTPFSMLAVEGAAVFASKGELRRLIQGGGISINKEKVTDSEMLINTNQLINKKYLLVQKGKKNYSIIRAI